MNRRKFVATVVVATLAGCTNDPLTDGSERTPSDTRTTESVTSITTSPSTQPSETSTQQSPSNRLTVFCEANDEIQATFQLNDLSDNTITYEESVTMAPNSSINLSDQFKPESDYEFTIFIQEESAFELNIYSHAGYEVTVHSLTEVEVTGVEEF